MNSKLQIYSLALALAAINAVPAQSISPAEARAIAKEAYIYGFPLVQVHKLQDAIKEREDAAQWLGVPIERLALKFAGG
jgi:hypothetical protein